MNEQPDAEAEIVGRHRQNIRKLGPRDVPIAAYPGSGNSLIGNILLELGLDYVDPYSEELGDDGTTRVVPDWAAYRTRLPATAARDDVPAAAEPATADQPRFFKNHLFPQEYTESSVRGAVLLVRDPRDAVYSSYRWFRSFSPYWIPDRPKGQGSFGEFLDGIGINDEPPVSHWAAFNATWLDALPRFATSLVITFEELKADTVGVTTRLLENFGIPVDPEAVEKAVSRSSFDAMRSHEDRAAAAQEAGQVPTGAEPPRINRRGKVGEWREWYGDPALAERFREPDVVRTAARFGYRLTDDAPQPPAAP
jgi:hypothetical protein